ncbi:P-loop containing nucleoside triphosphate hydrolase protein [Thelephora terrestris]|uniref:DNA 3'-5' helicase n=1 Tax=Thelephora terrestris TaxID=56493 RepID=A0A9P6HJF1_9AGAM|nr:P-loop containing nucleoside triphosphate hydrolase protein [Thelephora terrestris]
MRRHQESHEAANQRNLDLLEQARKSREGYDGENTREAFRAAVKAAFNGNEPRKFQLDVAEAMTLGLDSTVIAGTGSGKTLPWAIPLLLDENKNKVVLVISPLKALQKEHRRYRVLLASPEMCFVNVEFSKLLRDATWSKHTMFVVIDEAHCITQWGREFRTQYSTLNKLRSYFAPQTPLLLTSATLPPQTLSDIRDSLEVQDDRSFDLNLGNDRSNITPIVWPMKGGKDDFGSLNFVLSGGDIRRTVIYFNEKETARKACEYLQSLVPTKQSQIDFVHSSRCSGPQKRVLKQFQAGEINILCATEVVGMGTDLKNVTLVVQYMVPSSLSVWVQRAGRAGRSGLPSCAVLLYEPSVVQRVNTQDDEDDDVEEAEQEWSGDDFKKRNVEDSLRAYVMEEECRRALTDKYFDNPPRDKTGTSRVTFVKCVFELLFSLFSSML